MFFLFIYKVCNLGNKGIKRKKDMVFVFERLNGFGKKRSSSVA